MRRCLRPEFHRNGFTRHGFSLRYGTESRRTDYRSRSSRLPEIIQCEALHLLCCCPCASGVASASVVRRRRGRLSSCHRPTPRPSFARKGRSRPADVPGRHGDDPDLASLSVPEVAPGPERSARLATTETGETMTTDLREPELRRDVQSGPAEEKSAVAARQGVISGRVFLVLIASLLLAIIALGASYWFAH